MSADDPPHEGLDMRRPGALRRALTAAACAVALLVSACGPKVLAPELAAEASSSSTPTRPNGSPTVEAVEWIPVKDPDTAVWFAMPQTPLRQSSDRVTTSGAHLLANQYQAFYRTQVFTQPVAVVVTPYRVVGGAPTAARTVFTGMSASLEAKGAHRVRLGAVRTGRIDGATALFATLRFTTKDRKAEGYWRLAHATRPGFAVLLQVQVSGPRMTKQLIRDGNRVMNELVGSLRLP